MIFLEFSRFYNHKVLILAALSDIADDYHQTIKVILIALIPSVVVTPPAPPMM